MLAKQRWSRAQMLKLDGIRHACGVPKWGIDHHFPWLAITLQPHKRYFFVLRKKQACAYKLFAVKVCGFKSKIQLEVGSAFYRAGALG